MLLTNNSLTLTHASSILQALKTGVPIKRLRTITIILKTMSEKPYFAIIDNQNCLQHIVCKPQI